MQKYDCFKHIVSKYIQKLTAWLSDPKMIWTVTKSLESDSGALWEVISQVNFNSEILGGNWSCQEQCKMIHADIKRIKKCKRPLCHVRDLLSNKDDDIPSLLSNVKHSGHHSVICLLDGVNKQFFLFQSVSPTQIIQLFINNTLNDSLLILSSCH